jgi:hypothetical protein
MRDRDIILTGVPRSGTTLACHLLNRLPETVALHEPFSLGSLRRSRLSRRVRRGAVLGEIDAFFQDTRRSLLERGIAVSKQAGGAVPDNPIGAAEDAVRRPLPGRLRGLMRRGPGGASLRAPQVSRAEIHVGKPLSEDFRLCIKHPSIFAALLEDLVERYPCYAVVRNPLSVLGSWNSVDFPVQAGHARSAERLDPRLRRALRDIPGRFERQLHLLSWFFGRFCKYLPSAHILRYESIVESGGAELAVVAPAAVALRGPLESRNASPLYDRELLLRLGSALLASGGAYWEVYPQEVVEALLAGIERGEPCGVTAP